MFTGLVQELGTVVAVDRNGDGARLRIEGALAHELNDGDSVAVNGVCLTAAAVNGAAFSADAMAETLRRSSLGAVEPGELWDRPIAGNVIPLVAAGGGPRREGTGGPHYPCSRLRLVAVATAAAVTSTSRLLWMVKYAQ